MLKLDIRALELSRYFWILEIMCNCKEFTPIITGNDEANPLTSLEELEWAPEKWATLNKCKDCGQIWHVDMAKKDEMGLCIKLDKASDWDSMDVTQTRVQLMVNNHGGLSFDTCRWKQCSNNCVKGLAFCPQHAYFDMDIKI